MTVADMIAQLQKFDKTLQVVVQSQYCDYGGNLEVLEGRSYYHANCIKINIKEGDYDGSSKDKVEKELLDKIDDYVRGKND